MRADVVNAHVTATSRRARACAGLLAYRVATVTLRDSVVGRPFVSSTILNVAFPFAAFDIFIVIFDLSSANRRTSDCPRT